MADFPRDDFAALVRRLPRYAGLAWALARDPRVSKVRRAAVLAGAAYVLSPIDFVPGVIPVVGQLDDVAVALGTIKLALDGLRPEFRAQVLASAGLTQTDIDQDLRAVARITVWLGRAGARVGARLAATALDVGQRLVGGLKSRTRDRAR